MTTTPTAREIVRREMRTHLQRMTVPQLVEILRVWATDLNPQFMKTSLDLVDDLADVIDELRTRTH